MIALISSCLVLLVLLGLVERAARDRALAAVPIRVHVNGTRGKSTVTRLVHAALRQAGIPAVAKVTGTKPRLLLPDGSERDVRRRAPANIREQLWLLRRARRLGARAVVAECMAVRPDLQWTSERDMVRATIGVITNVRTDHTEVMGTTVEEIARSLANTVPRDGVLVVGDRRFLGLFEQTAAAARTRLVCADAVTSEGQAPDWMAEDRQVALAVTRELYIADDVALAGMALAVSDAGAARSGACHIDGRSVRWLDLTAANDPESFGALLAEDGVWTFDRGVPAGVSFLLVYNHRADRPGRLRRFANDSRPFREASWLVITGDAPPAVLWRAVKASRTGGRVSFAGSGRLPAEVRAVLGATPDRAAVIVFCGNTRGFDRDGLLEILSRRIA